VEANELATRLLRRYGLLLLLAVVLPTAALGAFVYRQQPTYTAHARILAAAVTPRAQAEAVALVSQVRAVATSRDLVAAALGDARLVGDPDEIVANVVVTGLGTSAVVDLAYTDADPLRAQQIAAALVKVTTTQLDKVRIGGLPEVLKSIDDQLTDLAKKRAPLLAAAQANPRDLIALSRLSGIDRLINDLSGDRNRLAEDAAAAGHATVLASPTVPDQSDSRGLPAKAGLAAIVGLALGLVAVGCIETLRPTVSGAARVGRLLDVPVLGAIRSDPVALSDVGRRVRLAAQRAKVSTVVLVRATRALVKPELVDRVEAATLRPDAVSARVAIPIEGRQAPVLTDSSTMDEPAMQAVTGLAVITANDNNKAGRAPALRRVCALDELDPAAESDKIGLVVLVGATTRLAAVHSVRDLLAASGWPLLGVLGDGTDSGGLR
jgi:capsular polysaccharide biosynthesis protein